MNCASPLADPVTGTFTGAYVNFGQQTLRGTVLSTKLIMDHQGQALEWAFDVTFANHPETLFVVPSGNDSSDDDAAPVYPCDSAADNLICVGAHTREDRLADFSNWGAESVDLFAPGSDILATGLHWSYPTVSGTSLRTRPGLLTQPSTKICCGA